MVCSRLSSRCLSPTLACPWQDEHINRQLEEAQMLPRDQHLFGPGPKRILSLDGGGVRGVVTLGFLEEVERLLRKEYGDDPSFRLCDHFDLIGGTSAGATIAAGLSLGFSVAELVSIYLELTHIAFQGSRWHGGILAPKFKGENVFQVLRKKLGRTKLGSEEVQTGSCSCANFRVTNIKETAHA
jgi:uncharacterized protein